MAFESVPWAVGGGAVHSSELARLVTYIATGGRQGVLGPTDLVVLPLAVPGAGVRIMPGASVIRNKALNTSADSYVMRAPSETIQATTPNGAAGPRSDLIYARVENPFISGEPWTTPGDVTVGPYIFPRVQQGVPSTTKSLDQLNLGYTGVPLARIDFPINTSTVTAPMIKDLRSVVNIAALTDYPSTVVDGADADLVRNYNYVLCPSVGPENGGDVLLASHTTFRDWPVAATWNVTFPDWCTHIEFDLRVNNVQVNNADAWGEVQLVVNGVAAKVAVFDFNLQVINNGIRQTMCIGGEYEIPAALRGNTVTCKLQSKYYTDARTSGSFIRANNSTYTSGFIFHHSRPVLA